MKPIAVLDSSVVVSGIGWRGGDARAVLRSLARREFISARISWLRTEWAETVARVATEEKRWRNDNWRAWLDWLNRASTSFEEFPSASQCGVTQRMIRSSWPQSQPAPGSSRLTILTCWNWKGLMGLPA